MVRSALIARGDYCDLVIQGVHPWTLAGDDLAPSLLELFALTFMHVQIDVNDTIAPGV